MNPATVLAAPDGGPVCVRVWGGFGCFSRPEFGVERVTYPLITPSAAIGLLDAIYWKPQFRWRIVAVDVLRKGTAMVVRRNEIDSRQTPERVADGKRFDAEEHRQQASTMLLCDVGYRIWAHADPMPGGGDHAKHRQIFRERVTAGQCHERPYLGCREFAADFCDADPAEPVVDWTEDLGTMVHYVYPPSASPSPTGGDAAPRFFRARIDHGRLTVPRYPRAAGHAR